MRKQLAPLSLDESFDLDFLDGELVMDPEIQPEARMLRQFFPGLPNLTYMRLVAVDEATGEDQPVLLATNALSATMGPSGNVTMPAGFGGRSCYRGIEAALSRLARALAAASLGTARYDGVVAFSQGANLSSMLLAVLEAAEAAAATAEAAAAMLPAGPDKVAAKAAAAASTEATTRRSKLLRPPFVAMFSPSDFGWPAQFADDALFGARALAAIDVGIRLAERGAPPEPGAQAGAPEEAQAEAQLAEALRGVTHEGGSLGGIFGKPLRETRVLMFLGKKDPACENGHALARRFAAGKCTVREPEECVTG